MDTKLIALRNDLAARRDRLHEKAETIEAEILKLTEQIDTVNTLIHNMTGVRQQISATERPVRSLTTRDVLETLRGDPRGFTAKEVVSAGDRLPVPLHLKLDSVRSFLSKLKMNGELDTWGKDGETVYAFKEDQWGL